MEIKNRTESAKLIKPLFIDGNFNREGKRMRAKHIKDISCDGGEYSLWISAGVKENDYPRAENDTHYLYVLAGEYLVPTGLTEFYLEQQIGWEQLVKSWYGDMVARARYIDGLKKDKTWEEGNKLIEARLAEEKLFVDDYGKNEQAQAEYIKAMFDKRISTYIDARDNGGMYVDFVGAALIGDIDRCLEVSAVVKAKRAAIEAQKRKERMEKDQKEREEREQKEQAAIMEAEEILKNGGKITGGEMIVKLADTHGIIIPIRTRGWILKSLAEFTVDGSSMSYRYRKTKNGRGSDKVYEVVSAIRKALTS